MFDSQFLFNKTLPKIPNEKLIIYLVKFAAKDSISRFLSNFLCFHLRLHIESDSTITWNFHVLLHVLVKVPRAISIPEESDMTKLNSFTVGREGKSADK